MARIYFDDELKIPIRYEAYDFPTQEGGKPVLLEEYTYLDVKVNNGFTDKDFEIFRKPSSTQKASCNFGERCRPVRFITSRGRGVPPVANR
jgi:outer membrane lipoprotein-sorting protein